MNKKKELRGLFHKWIERTNRVGYSNNFSNGLYSNGGGNPYYGGNRYCGNDGFNGTIYFYEWSDLFREPKRYYSIDLFEQFLKDSGIYLALYQRDIIKNLKWNYIACKKGGKELIICQSYDKLLKLMRESEIEVKSPSSSSDGHSIGFTASQPVNKKPTVVVNGKPKILSQTVYEPNGRWFG